jgi:16S rRNA (cytidine1402-2'-O)-methyltransferase
MGQLFLVPTPLDFGCDSLGPLTEVLPQATIVRAAALQHWVCENAKSARAFLKRVGEVCPLGITIQQQQLQELQELQGCPRLLEQHLLQPAHPTTLWYA